RDRDVAAKPERIVPIDPRVITGLGAARILYIFQLRAGKLIKRPPFRTMLSRRGWAVQNLALSSVEACEMAARQRDPVHAVCGNITAARPEARRRWFVNFGQRRVGRVRTRHNPNDITGVSHHGSP